ncbi:ESCRT-III subunit protein VPS20 PWA37_004535 [Arxiozyma heterogenica]|uniref:ESCRT-III subunit protein VPS20 n=1 Tax=Arxiozyma heterogenica TaxID=278026 RepID=UPI002F088816
MGQTNSKIRITETDKAVLQLKRSKDEIHKFTRRTDKLIEQEKIRIKQMIKDNPENYKQNKKIRLLLKRMHYQEYLVQQASDQLTNLEFMISNIEFKLIEVQFLQGLKKGNDILTKLNKEFVNVDEVISDFQEQLEYQNEVDNALAHSVIGVGDIEVALDKELDDLENELKSKMLTNMPTTTGLASLESNKENSKAKVIKVNHKNDKIPLYT